MLDTQTLSQLISHEVNDRFGFQDSLERVLARTKMIFELFYDEDPDAPEQAIGDALLDLVHTADAAGLDIFDLLSDALRHREYELEEWGQDTADSDAASSAA